MLINHLGLALLDCRPVQLAGADAFYAKFLGIFQVVPNLSVEQQRFRRNAAHMQACAAEIRVLLNESGFQAVLARADGGSVSGRAAANHCNVINCVWQSRTPLTMDEPRQTND